MDQVSYFNKTVASKDMSGYYLLLNGEYAYNKSYSVGYDFGSIKRLDRYTMGALSTLYICFALKKHDSDFIKAYFDSLKWYREIYKISAEGARNHGLLNVPTDAFFETKHYLPQNLNEQRKIADFMIALEHRIDAQQSLVDNLKKYKRGLQNRFFFKRSHLSSKPSEIDSHDVKPLGSVVRINPKTGALPEAFIYIDLECVESGVLNSKKLLSRNSAPSRAQRLLEEGDFLYQMVRPYQKTITISKRILNIQQLRLPDMRKSDAQRWTLNLYTSNFRQTILPVKQCFAVQVQGIQLSMQMILRKFLFGFLHLISRRKSVRLYPFSGQR